MDLVTPGIGLTFWTGLIFLILLFLLTKFAWKPLLAAVNKRDQNIQEALDMAKTTKAEMEKLKAQNENLLKEARIQRDEIIKEAKATSDRMIESAKAKSKEEADKIVDKARSQIEAEKLAAVAELRKETANMAIEVAEKIIRKDLSSSENQTKLAEELVNDITLN